MTNNYSDIAALVPEKFIEAIRIILKSAQVRLIILKSIWNTYLFQSDQPNMFYNSIICGCI